MFQLNYQSHKSVYEQIVDNIKEQIMTGVLKENTQLPTVRELSQLLTINPHTVQKAFQTLDQVLNRKLYPSDDCKLYYPI